MPSSDVPLRSSAGSAGSAAARDGRSMGPSTFWVTQPVEGVGVGERSAEPSCAELDPTWLAGRPDPLPQDLQWASLDVGRHRDCRELARLLREHYAEDQGSTFRLTYPEPFVRWALSSPRRPPDWIVAVRDGAGELAAFVAATPATLVLDRVERRVAVVSFLCARRDLRGLGVASCLIREVAARVVRTGSHSALFTTAARLPMTPLATCRYYCRLLRVSRLVAAGFVEPPPYLTARQFDRLYELPRAGGPGGFRKMSGEDVAGVVDLLNHELAHRRLGPRMDRHETSHWLLGGPDGLVETWVHPAAGGGARIDGVFSFYRLPLVSLQPQGSEPVRAAYWFYGASRDADVERLLELAAARAAAGGADVFFALDSGALRRPLRQIGFLPTDAVLRYYTYNWSAPPMRPEEVGLAIL